MPITLTNQWSDTTLNRFLKYVKIHSTSDPNSTEYPSHKRLWDIAYVLKEELEDIGMKNVRLDKNGYVTAELPANIVEKTPTIAFIAHYDTSPDFSGENVNPIIWKNYNGQDLILNPNFILKTSEFLELLKYKNQTLITTDGTTLLGADDKAGIAEIITAMDYLIQNPDIKHGNIKVAFTPDEEIGQGVKYFDIQQFGADYGWTMDGGEIGELEFENFNAASVQIHFSGKSVHPGAAKNKMINAGLIAVGFANELPGNEVPSKTEGYEGFYHLTHISGNVEKAELNYIIRDHDEKKFSFQKQYLLDLVNQYNRKYGENTVSINIKDQYFNMKKMVEDKPYIIERAKKAIENAGITPIIKPIRGGTDGAILSYMGLPCPNIFAGGHNFHGPYEFIPLESMEKAVEVIINICQAPI